MFSVEGAKRDAEYKLGSIVSSLRRTIGYGSRSNSGNRARSRSPSPGARRRPISPSKGFDSIENRASPILRRTSRSPHPRSHSPIYDDDEEDRIRSNIIDVADIDPEQIRGALRDFVQSFMTTERDREDCIGKKRESSSRIIERNLFSFSRNDATSTNQQGTRRKPSTNRTQIQSVTENFDVVRRR